MRKPDPVTELDTLKNILAINYKDDTNYKSFIECYNKSKTLLPKEKQDECEEFIKIINCVSQNTPQPYNEISEYFDKQNKPFLAFLCRLYSLTLVPKQKDIYIKAKEYFENHDPFTLESSLKLSPNKCAVSVIMPTYNRGQKAYDSIKSVLEQDFQDFELVIINDGGTDEIEGILNLFKTDKIKYYKISHKGLAGALNEGLKKAGGEYIAYLDDDDIYYPNHLKLLYNEAKTGKYDFVYSSCQVFYGKYENNKFKATEKRIVKIEHTKRFLHITPYIPILTVMHKKNCLDKVGLFNENMAWSMDWFQWIKMSRCYDLHFVNTCTGEYRKNETSMTSTSTYKRDLYCGRILKLFFNSFYGCSVLAISGIILGDKIFVKKLLEKIENSGYVTSSRIRELTKVLYKNKLLSFILIKGYRRIMYFMVKAFLVMPLESAKQFLKPRIRKYIKQKSMIVELNH